MTRSTQALPPTISGGVSGTRATHRYKKLSSAHQISTIISFRLLSYQIDTRATLQVVREEDLDIIEDDVSRSNSQKAETGVEKSEESVSLLFLFLFLFLFFWFLNVALEKIFLIFFRLLAFLVPEEKLHGTL